MKNKFSGYYHPDSAFFDTLFKDAIIILDTNILLDLYRVSPKTSKELIEIIKKLGERIWIPYRVASEYHRNLFSVVGDQIKKYEDATKAMDPYERLSWRREIILSFLMNYTKKQQAFLRNFYSSLINKGISLKML